MKVKTILVPLDGSSLAEAALTPAMEIARESGGRLVLLRAAVGHRSRWPIRPTHRWRRFAKPSSTWLRPGPARRCCGQPLRCAVRASKTRTR